MRLSMLLAAIYILTACSAAGLLPNPDIQANVGAENQVTTGAVVSQHLEINDSEHPRINSGKYHIESKEKLTVTINETNRWVLPALGLYIFGKPLLLWSYNIFRRRLRRTKK